MHLVEDRNPAILRDKGSQVGQQLAAAAGRTGAQDARVPTSAQLCMATSAGV